MVETLKPMTRVVKESGVPVERLVMLGDRVVAELDLPHIKPYEHGVEVKVMVRLDGLRPRVTYELEAYVPRHREDGSTEYLRRRRMTETTLIMVGDERAVTEERLRSVRSEAVLFAAQWAREVRPDVAAVTLRDAYFKSTEPTVEMVLRFYLERFARPGWNAELERRREGKPTNNYWKQVISKIGILLDYAALDDEGRPIVVRKIDTKFVEMYRSRRLAAGHLNNFWRNKEKPADGKFRGPRGPRRRDQRPEDIRGIKISTVRDDLLILERAIKAALNFEVDDPVTGRKMPVLNVNPLRDLVGSKSKVLKGTEARLTPLIDQDRYEVLLAAASAEDESKNAYYATYKRYKAPRCPMFSEMLLRVARETGRRRAALAYMDWEDIILDPERIASVVYHLLGAVRVTPAEVERLFPYGIIIWPRETDKNRYYRLSPISRRFRKELDAFARTHPNCPGGRHARGTIRDASGPLFYHPESFRQCAPQVMSRWLGALFATAGLPMAEQEGWHMFRRLFRTERAGHFSNKVVAYLGGWSQLNALNTILDVDMTQAMNMGYMAPRLMQLYACAAFDGAKLARHDVLTGVSEIVIEQMLEEGYVSQESAVPARAAQPKTKAVATGRQRPDHIRVVND